MMRRSTFRIRVPLHNTIRGDKKYLAWAKAEWNWFDHRSGMIKTSYLISDGPSGPGEKGRCVNTSAKQGQKIWTAQSFKGIFVRDLTMMAVIAKTTAYEAKDTNSHHQLGVFWAGPIADRTSWSQASALDALVASLKLP